MAPVARAHLATPQRSPWGQGMTRQADRFFMQQQFQEMNFNKPTFAQCPTVMGTNQRVQNANSLTLPKRMLKKKRAVPQVHWMLSPMLVQVRRRKPLGAHPRHPLLRGATKGIMPCKGSVPGHIENFEGLRISILVSHCFERLLKRMPFPIGIGVARSKMPCREATTPLRLRKLCSRPWRGWPGTMPR